MNSKTTMTQLTSHKSHAIPLEEIVVLSDQDGIPSGAKYLAIEVQDNSMAPLLTMGSTAIVQFQSGVDDGDIVAAIFDNGNIVIRKVQKIGDKIDLIPVRTDYTAFAYEVTNVKNEPVTFLGKVVEMRCSFN